MGAATGFLGALLIGSPLTAHGQNTQTNQVTATAPSLGAVLAVSPLEPGRRLPDANLFVSGTVTTRHNGPYQLQVRLSAPFTTPDGGVVHTVQTRTATGSLVTLGTIDWVTVATGPGSAGSVNPVEFLILWAAGPKSPSLAVRVPVVYQVVPSM
jgi:hypothetical protein